jgi:hypothetical protein
MVLPRDERQFGHVSPGVGMGEGPAAAEKVVDVGHDMIFPDTEPLPPRGAGDHRLIWLPWPGGGQSWFVSRLSDQGVITKDRLG